MIHDKMATALNEQINEEYYSAYLYLAMSAFSAAIGLPGFANWFRLQYEEEIGHALRLFDYMIEQNARPALKAIQEPPADFGGPLELFQAALAHEQHITGCINQLADLALREKDHATLSMLRWFVDEQVEEEANAAEIVDRLSYAEGNKSAILMIDRDLAQRKPLPPAEA